MTEKAPAMAPRRRALRARACEIIEDRAIGPVVAAAMLAQVDEQPANRPTLATPTLLASLQLRDGNWVNFTAATLPAAAARHGALLSTTAMAIGTFIISVALVRTITAPLRALVHAADRTGVDVSAPGMRETGPDEVRRPAVAFNRSRTGFGDPSRIARIFLPRSHTI